MRIAGFNKTTLLDYPQHVAATVFTAGCNFLCPFCYNSDLVVERCFTNHELIDEKVVFDFLARRRSVLSGLCISGGEPAIQQDLADFIYKVKEMGYLVKLDTNGYRPDVIKGLLADNLLDYIAMDLKSTKDGYSAVCGLGEAFVGDKIDRSVELLKLSGIPYEFRTTVVKELHSIEDLIEIGYWVGGSDWYLQGFVDNEKVLKRGFTSYSDEEIAGMASLLNDRGICVKVRGIDNLR